MSSAGAAIASDQPVATAPSPTSGDVLTRLLALQEEVADEFQVTLRGITIRFRLFRDHGDIVRHRDKLRAFVKRMASPKNAPESWRPYHTSDPETLGMVYALSEFSIAPKMTQLDLLRLAKEAGPIFREIWDRVEAASSLLETVDEGVGVEEAKKDSEATSPPATD